MTSSRNNHSLYMHHGLPNEYRKKHTKKRLISYTNMSACQYKKSHCGVKKILRPSNCHSGISYTGKTASQCWNCPLRVLLLFYSWWSITRNLPRLNCGLQPDTVIIVTRWPTIGINYRCFFAMFWPTYVTGYIIDCCMSSCEHHRAE